MAIADVLRAFRTMKMEGTIRDFMVYGSVAAMVHTRPFYTDDVDIGIPIDTMGEWEAAIHRLADFGPFKGQAVEIMGTPVDMFPTDVSPIIQDALEQARRKKVEGFLVKVASAEHLLLEALRAFRKPEDHSRVVLLDAHVDRAKLKGLFRRLDRDGELKGRYQSLMRKAP